VLARLSLLWLLAWAGSGLGACRSGGDRATRPAALDSADLAAIRALDSSFAAAANAGDLDRIVAIYAPDAVLLPPNLPPQRGRNAVRSFWSGLLKSYTVNFEVGADTIEGRGDLAYSVGHYRFTAVPKDKANPGMADEGKFVEILKKQGDGSWKYAVDMYSSNLAGQR
jgi:uncharacterized protein (TIGR02246 family)